MAKRDLHLENLLYLEQQLKEGKISQAAYDLQKARLISDATQSGTTKTLSTLAIVAAVFIALWIIAKVVGY